MMRIILYTGKGGVGKTSISAATAIQSAKQGLKTLVMTTYTCSPGTFMNANSPMKIIVMNPATLNGAVNVKTNNIIA